MSMTATKTNGIGNPVFAKTPGGDTADRELRSDRDIDLPDKDHQGHTDRDQQRRKVVDDQVSKISGSEERRSDNSDNNQQYEQRRCG
jgi:hypothetical protein